MLKIGLSGIGLLRMAFMWLFALSMAHAQSGAGTTVALADVMGPLTPGQVVVTDSGVTRVWGSPQTQADGTQLFPRLVVGLPNTTTSISYFSSDIGGLKLHKSESATGSTSTWAPAQLIYPATMTIGQTYETIHAQTSVANIGAAPVLSTIKIRTTILGFEPVLSGQNPNKINWLAKGSGGLL